MNKFCVRNAFLVAVCLAAAVEASWLRSHSTQTRRKNIDCYGEVSDSRCDNLLSSIGISRSMQEDRVSRLDHDGIDCLAGEPDDPSADIVVDFISFFYAIETSASLKPSTMKKIERKLFFTISSSLLWCYKKNRPIIDVGRGSVRLLQDLHNNLACKHLPCRFYCSLVPPLPFSYTALFVIFSSPRLCPKSRSFFTRRR